ncbi:hypothetical protein ElyMa_003511300 [Elysia marginata]|uniref:Uncharacterized protein n=1 Tax=Elysia marginata TaxID=1093978 RepID=A0AAV4EGE3_9GAST|nr:hypothetical protein ElyMa_003511300 [Elysia marginata]
MLGLRWAMSGFNVKSAIVLGCNNQDSRGLMAEEEKLQKDLNCKAKFAHWRTHVNENDVVEITRLEVMLESLCVEERMVMVGASVVGSLTSSVGWCELCLDEQDHYHVMFTAN